MTEPDKPKLNWDFKLTFDEPEDNKAKPVAQEIPPRQVIQERAPRIYKSLLMLWGTPELQHYLEQTLFTERSNRQGFPPDIMSALMKIYAEHTKLLKSLGHNTEDVWDL